MERRCRVAGGQRACLTSHRCLPTRQLHALWGNQPRPGATRSPHCLQPIFARLEPSITELCQSSNQHREGRSLFSGEKWQGRVYLLLNLDSGFALLIPDIAAITTSLFSRGQHRSQLKQSRKHKLQTLALTSPRLTSSCPPQYSFISA